MFRTMRTLVAALFFLSACAAVPPHVEREKLDDMIDEIIVWIAANSKYPPQRAPRVLFVDKLPAEFARLERPYKSSGAPENAPAGYLHHNRTVYLPQSLRLDIEYDVSVLAHELVHFLQYSSGQKPETAEERETEAVVLSYEASVHVCRSKGKTVTDGFAPGSCN